MVDCIIIGSGVAGISAALTLKANGKTALIFGSKALSEKIEKAELIQNYPGLSNVTGKGFVTALKQQLEDAKIEINSEKVSGVYAMKEKFAVATQQGGMYESKSVILACGVESVKQIEGEDTYLGRGVSACATCDGFLYKGKTIAVFCTSKRLEHEIGYLADIADKVYLIPMYKGVEIARDNVEIIRKMPTKIDGAKRVERVCFGQDAVEIDGMFVLRECTSPAILVGGLDMQDGHVKVNRDMSTNLKGCYAAGDCTGRPYQYAKAVGEGNVAAHSVSEFLK
ncbi:MAG: NAD(P)/FAD-dependent oxidoreductase [Clostridia bacterium]|nr:NAD(P)/FAD-dependent oxidoreductase [Clostridia bacterium]